MYIFLCCEAGNEALLHVSPLAHGPLLSGPLVRKQHSEANVSNPRTVNPKR